MDDARTRRSSAVPRLFSLARREMSSTRTTRACAGAAQFRRRCSCGWSPIAECASRTCRRRRRSRREAASRPRCRVRASRLPSCRCRGRIRVRRTAAQDLLSGRIGNRL